MFSKKPEQSSPRQSPRTMSNSGGTFSVIGADVTIRGNIEAKTDLHIDGKVIGDVTCASLVQGEGSRIEGEIRVKTARLSGAIEGRIAADELVVLKKANIVGDVSYVALTIEQGAAVNGRFAPQSEKPAAAAKPQEKSEPASADANSEARLSLAG